jgi:purine-binding chemotaxis protein CheW
MSVVIEHNGELFSLIVDRVGDVLSLDNSKIEKTPLTLNPTWCEVSTGVYQVDDKIMVLLNTNALFQTNGGNK